MSRSAGAKPSLKELNSAALVSKLALLEVALVQEVTPRKASPRRKRVLVQEVTELAILEAAATSRKASQRRKRVLFQAATPRKATPRRKRVQEAA